jgi:hypothetical protein
MHLPTQAPPLHRGHDRGSVRDGMWPSLLDDTVVNAVPRTTQQDAQAYNTYARGPGLNDLQGRLAQLAALRSRVDQRLRNMGGHSLPMKALLDDIDAENRSIRAAM